MAQAGGALKDQISKEEKERIERIAKAREAYDGEHPETMDVEPDGPDDNVIINICRKVVRAGISHLFGREIAFNISGAERNDEGEPSGGGKTEAEAEDYLTSVWERVGWMSFLRTLALDGALGCNAFIRINPPDEKAEEPLPGLSLVAPEYVRPFYRADDYTQVYRWRIQFTGLDEDEELRTFRTDIERTDRKNPESTWSITDYEAKGDTDRGFSQTGTSTWEHPFAPIVTCQNLPRSHEFWGESDLPHDLIRLNFGGNALVSNMLRIVRLHAHPKPWVEGASPSQVAQVNWGTDSILTIPKGSAIGQLELTQGLTSSLELLKILRSFFHEISETPSLSPEEVHALGQLSGVALEILYRPLTEKTDDKRLTYGGLLNETNRRLLVMADNSGWEELRTAITWTDPLPKDPVAEGQSLLIDKQLGASNDTLLERRGYDPDEERRKRDAQEEEGQRRIREGGEGEGAGGEEGGGSEGEGGEE